MLSYVGLLSLNIMLVILNKL